METNDITNKNDFDLFSSADWLGSNLSAERHFLSGLWYLPIKRRSAQRWRRAEVPSPPSWGRAAAWRIVEIIPSMPFSETPAPVRGWVITAVLHLVVGGQQLYCPHLATQWNDSLLTLWQLAFRLQHWYSGDENTAALLISPHQEVNCLEFFQKMKCKILYYSTTAYCLYRLYEVISYYH